MLTPTLLDVAAITGLKPIGETFDSNEDDSEISFDFSRFAYGVFIMDNHDTKFFEVSAEEHVAFLNYCLSMYIFCTRSIQVAKGCKTLAFQLHKGKNICLSKLILGSLYEVYT